MDRPLYTTTDGCGFDDPEKAKKHKAVLDLVKSLRDAFGIPPEVDLEDIINFMLKRGKYKLPGIDNR